MTDSPWQKWLDSFPVPTDEERAESLRQAVALADTVEQSIEYGELKIKRNGIDGRPDMGGMCPWQLTGTWNDQPCYMRFRGNSASMTVWSDEEWGTEVLASSVHGWAGDDMWAGSLDDDEVVPFVRALTKGLRPVDNETNPSHQTLLGRAVDAAVSDLKKKETDSEE